MYGSLNRHLGFSFETFVALMSVLAVAREFERSELWAGQASVLAAHSGGALPTDAAGLAGPDPLVDEAFLEELPPQPARATANATRAATIATFPARPAVILMGLVATAAS